jgi:hypothetical protein
VSPERDRAIDELASALGVERATAAGVVDVLIMAAARESMARVGETVVEPLEQALGIIGEACKSGGSGG